jgi:hypothetical protein
MKTVKSASAMLDCITSRGYLEKDADQYKLKARGSTAGAFHVEKSRYGPHFLWPQDLPIVRWPGSEFDGVRKRSKRGIKTPNEGMDPIDARLKAVKQDFE